MFKLRISSTVLSSILTGFLLFLFSISTIAANLKIDNSFNAEVLDKGLVIKTVAEQPDGKLLIGGTFLRVNGISRVSLARLNPDGTLDTTFSPVLSGIRTVFSIIVQPDGRILIAGGFNSVNGEARLCVARLNSDGSVDVTFTSPFVSTNLAEAMTLQPDGKIIVAGFLFYSLNGSPRRHVARLNADGSFDTTFDIGQQGADSLVNALAVQPDGKVLVGGYFTSFAGAARRGIARLNNNGSLDSTFNPGTGANNNVETIAVQPDGKIIIGGNFTDYNGSPRLRLARINADGSLDASFNTSNTTDGTVAEIVLLAGGKLLVGGSFQTVNGTPRRRFARLNANGTVDATFNPPAPDTPSVNAIVVQADGRIVLGGNFAFLSRISSSGSIDSAFNPLVEQQGVITAIAVQPNGKLLVGGQFTRINGVARRNIARLNPDGSVDTAFQASVSALVSAITVEPDGRIIIGGYFTAVNNISRNYIARLSPDGAFVDSNFLPLGANNVVLKIALQPNGQILVGGYFGTVGGAERRRLARVNADGTLDQSFTAGTGEEDLAVGAITVQPDGKILVGGSFTMFGGSPRSSLARLHSDGNLDTSFNAGVNGAVARIISQPDGWILVGGSFSSVNGAARQGIARLSAEGGLDSSFNTTFNIFSTIDDLLVQPDGRILVAGNFQGVNGASPRLNIARLNLDGSSDNTFSVDAGSRVSQLVRQPDGKILVGGYFNSVNEQERLALVRLTPSVSASYDFDGDGKADQTVFRPSDSVWYLLRSNSGFTAAQFGNSTDKIVPADFDGDRKTDIAVFRDGVWYWLSSSNGSFSAVQFGQANDVPVPADYSGDGRAELAVYRGGVWYTLNLANNQFQGVQFGISSDKPVPADYDADGKTDFAVYRDGTWYLLRSSAGFAGVQFGIASDKSVVGDYDGDGKADPAVYRAGVWYILGSAQGFYGVQFGVAGDIPVAADYDGDGKTDLGVFRDGVWYLLRTQQGFGAVQFGIGSDKPIPAAFVP